jgi:hypothetical protein
MAKSLYWFAVRVIPKLRLEALVRDLHLDAVTCWFSSLKIAHKDCSPRQEDNTVTVKLAMLIEIADLSL